MATSVYTYLHNGDFNSSRIVNMDDCMCKLYNVIRDDSEFMKDFDDVDNKYRNLLHVAKKQDWGSEIVKK